MLRTSRGRRLLGAVAVLALGPALAACDPPPDAPRDRVPQIVSTVPAEVDPATFAGPLRPSPDIEEVAVGLDGRTVRVVWTGAPLACEGPARMRFAAVDRVERSGGDWLRVALEVRAAAGDAVPEPALCDSAVRYSTTERIPDEMVVTDGTEVVGATDEG
ncbi:MAG TPA: hypothetical protein VEW93_05860 [Acidimicrobiales bacterium]|nr:hypothetical protein [Acidimicrobiales bacterium]